MKRGSSLRFIECPMPETSADVRGAMARSPRDLCRVRPQLGGGVAHRLDDVHVAGAAAEVARDRLPDLRLAGMGVRLQQRITGHQHARRAVAALQAVLLPEAFLDGMELAVLLEPLDRR